MKKILLYLLIFNYCSLVEAQSIILKNPSFEGIPAASTTPDGWYDCGAPGKSPPDIQPNKTFRVVKAAYEGETYVGMITRDKDTWEAISQKLNRPLKSESCYYFSLYLARSETYLSVRRNPRMKVQLTQPVVLRIWAGNDYCDKEKILAETPAIIHTDWREYKLKLEPLNEYDFITFEAFYTTPYNPYNGNILIDNCSPISVASCVSEEFSDYGIHSIENINTKEDSILLRKEMEQLSAETKQQLENDNIISEEIEVKTPANMWQLDKQNIPTYQIIRIYDVYTSKDPLEFNEKSYRVLDEIYDFLAQVPDFFIEISGHESKIRGEIDYNDFSLMRAKGVTEYLINKGLDKDRIISTGYGIEDNIATDKTHEKNQRIEIMFIE